MKQLEMSSVVSEISAVQASETQTNDGLPSSVGARVTGGNARLTRKDKIKFFNKTTVPAMYWINPNIEDEFLKAASIYTKLHVKVTNFDKESSVPYFAINADAVLIPNNIDMPNESELRYNSKKYSSRIANYLAQYINAVTMWYASLVNLYSLKRFTLSAAYKQIASDLRPVYIQNQCARIEQYPMPVGKCQYLIDNARIAEGFTMGGAAFTALPYYRTDIYGNVGCHTLPIDNLLSTKGSKSKEPNVVANVTEQTDDISVEAFVASISNTILEYGVHHANGRTPHDPVVLNGTVVTLVDGDKEYSDGVTMMSNSSGYLACQDSPVDGVALKGDHIAASAWDTYKFWEEYVIRNFSRMRDPDDKIRVIAEELGLLETAIKLPELNRRMNNLPLSDAHEILKAMTYRAPGSVNTATIVKMKPLVYGSEASEKSGLSPYDSGAFTSNFDRYTFWKDINHPEVASLIPTFTPVMFNDAAEDAITYDDDGEVPYIPFVVNTIPTVGEEVGDNTTVAAPIGKVLSLLDYMAFNSADPLNDRILTKGLEADKIKEIFTAPKAVKFSEFTEQIRVPVMPLFNNADPFQCGFNVLMAAPCDDESGEWQNHFFNEVSSAGRVSVNKQPVVPSSDKTYKYCTIGYSLEDGKDDFSKFCPYGLIFVGDQIFKHPIARYQSKYAALPTYEFNGKAQTTQIELLTNYLINAIDNEGVKDEPVAKFWDILKYSQLIGYEGETRVWDSVLQGMKTSKKFKMRFMTFNPLFGPISIPTMTLKDDDLPLAMDPTTSWDLFKPNQEQTRIENNAPRGLNVDTVTLSRANVPIWRRDLAVYEWINYIDILQFNPAENGVVKTERPFSELYFQPGIFLSRMTMANGIFQAANIEDDYKPFWEVIRSDDIKDATWNNNNVGDTNKVPTDDSVASENSVADSIRTASQHKANNSNNGHYDNTRTRNNANNRRNRSYRNSNRDNRSRGGRGRDSSDNDYNPFANGIANNSSTGGGAKSDDINKGIDQSPILSEDISGNGKRITVAKSNSEKGSKNAKGFEDSAND